MKIIHARPPNFDQIARAFPRAHGKHVIFAYGDAIYAPFVTEVPPQLVAHEEVHCARQQPIGPEEWWRRYIEDVEFRFSEEVMAHRAEYSKLLEVNPSRHVRRAGLSEIAKRLASPLYGNMTTWKLAKELIA